MKVKRLLAVLLSLVLVVTGFYSKPAAAADVLDNTLQVTIQPGSMPIGRNQFILPISAVGSEGKGFYLEKNVTFYSDNTDNTLSNEVGTGVIKDDSTLGLYIETTLKDSQVSTADLTLYGKLADLESQTMSVNATTTTAVVLGFDDAYFTAENTDPSQPMLKHRVYGYNMGYDQDAIKAAFSSIQLVTGDQSVNIELLDLLDNEVSIACVDNGFYDAFDLSINKSVGLEKDHVASLIFTSTEGTQYTYHITYNMDMTPPQSPPNSGDSSTEDDGGENTPETGGENTPETDGENTPEAGEENTPEAGEENTPETGGENTPETGGENTPEADGENAPKSDEENVAEVSEANVAAASEEHGYEELWCYPKAQVAGVDKIWIGVAGYNLEDTVSIVVYKNEKNDNNIIGNSYDVREYQSWDDNANLGKLSLLVSLSESITTGTQYIVELSNGNTGFISFEIAGTIGTYEMDPDVIVKGKTSFLVPLYTQGDIDGLDGSTVAFFSDKEMTTTLTGVSGTVVMIESSQLAVQITLPQAVADVIDSNTHWYYDIANDEGIKNRKSNELKMLEGFKTFAIDFDAFEESYQNSLAMGSTDYIFKFRHLGISKTLENITRVDLMLDGEVVYDLLSNKDNNDNPVKFLFDDTADILTIKLNEDAYTLKEDRNYYVYIEKGSTNPSTGSIGTFYTKVPEEPVEFNVNYQDPLAVQESTDKFEMFIEGDLVGTVTDFQLFKGSNQIDNLISNVDIVDKEQHDDGFGFTKADITLSQQLVIGDDYHLFVILDSDEKHELPFAVHDMVYALDGGMPVGKTKFNMNLDIWGDSESFDPENDEVEVILYKNNNPNDTIAGDTSIGELYGGWVVNVDLEQSLDADTSYHYSINGLEHEKLRRTNSLYTYNDMEFKALNHARFDESQMDSGNANYEIELTGHHLWALDEIESVQIVDDNDNTLYTVNKESVTLINNDDSYYESYEIIIPKENVNLTPDTDISVKVTSTNDEKHPKAIGSFHIRQVHGYELEHYEPYAISKHWDRIHVNFDGYRMDDTTSFKLYQVGENSSDNISVIKSIEYEHYDNWNDSEKYGRKWYDIRLKDMVPDNDTVLDSSKDYKMEISNGETTFIRPLNVANYVYSLNNDGMVPEDDTFYLAINQHGYEGDLEGKIVKFYTNEELTIEAGMEGVVTELKDDLYVVKVDKKDPGYTFLEDDVWYYDVIGLENMERHNRLYAYDQFNIVQTDYEAFVASLKGDTTDFVFYVHGINEDLSNMSSIQLIRYDEEEVFNILPNDEVNVSVVPGEYADILTISIPKDQFMMELGENYRISFKHTGGRSRDWDSFRSERTLALAHEDQPFNATDGLETAIFLFEGYCVDRINDIHLYEIDSEDNAVDIVEASNADTIWYDGHDNYGFGKIWVKLNRAFDSQKSYELTFSDGDVTIKKEIALSSNTVYIYGHGFIEGKNQGYTRLGTNLKNGILDDLVNNNKTVSIFDAYTNANVIGTGTLVKIDDLYYIKVNLNNNQTFTEETKYILKFDDENILIIYGDEVKVNKHYFSYVDQEKFRESINDDDNQHYIIRAIGSHIINNPQAYDKIFIGTENKDAQNEDDRINYLVDIKQRLADGDTGVSYEVDAYSGLCQLIIKIDKNIVNLKDIKENIIFGMSIQDDLPLEQYFIYDPPYEVEDYEPYAISRDWDEIHVGFMGYKMNETSSLKIYEADSQGNEIESVIDEILDQNSGVDENKHGAIWYKIKLKDMVDDKDYFLDPLKDYKMEVSDGETTFTCSLDVANYVYSVNDHGMVPNDEKFYLNINHHGYKDDLVGEIVEFSKKEDFEAPGAATDMQGIVTEIENGVVIVQVGLKEGGTQTFSQDDECWYYRIPGAQSGAMEKHNRLYAYDQFNIVETDYEAFVASLNEGDTTDFVFYVHGINGDLSNMDKIELIRHDEEEGFNILDNLGDKGVIASLESGDYADKLTIKIPNDVYQMDFDQDYRMYFKHKNIDDIEGREWDWWSFRRKEVHGYEAFDYYPFAQLSTMDELNIKVWGYNLDQTREVIVYEKGDPNKTDLIKDVINDNPIELIDAETNKYQAFFDVVLTDRFESGNAYVVELKNDKDEIITFDIKGVDGTYAIYYKSIIKGSDSFIMPLITKGSVDELKGKSVIFYTDETMNNVVEEVENATVIDIGNSYLAVKIELKNPVEQPVAWYYDIPNDNNIGNPYTNSVTLLDRLFTPFAIDYNAFDNSIQEGNNYEFKFRQIGIPANLEDVTQINLIKHNSDEEPLELLQADGKPIDGVTIDVSSDDISSILSIKVSQSKLEKNVHYKLLIEMEGDQDTFPFGDFFTKSYELEDYEPYAILDDWDNMHVGLIGNNMDDTASLEIYQVINQTEVSVLDNITGEGYDRWNDDNNFGKKWYDVKLIRTLDTSGEYFIRITDDKGKDFTRPLEVDKLVYCAKFYSIPLEDKTFLVSFDVWGNSGDLVGKEFKMYYDEDLTQPVAFEQSAYVNDLDGFIGAKVTLAEEVQLQEGQDHKLFYYKLIDAPGVEGRKNIIWTMNGLEFTQLNHKKFEESQMDLDNDYYEFEVIGQYFWDVNDIKEVQIIDISNEEIVYASFDNTSNPVITLNTNDYYDAYTIDVLKTTLESVNAGTKIGVKIIRNNNESRWFGGYRMWKPAQLAVAYDSQAFNVTEGQDYAAFYFEGFGVNRIKEVHIYEVDGTNKVEVLNPEKIHIGTFWYDHYSDYGLTNLSMGLIDNYTFDSNKEYEFVFKDDSETVTRPIKVSKNSIYIHKYGLLDGENEGYIQIGSPSDLDLDELINQNITVQIKDTYDSNESIGTGSVIKVEDSYEDLYFIKAKLNDNATFSKHKGYNTILDSNSIELNSETQDLYIVNGEETYVKKHYFSTLDQDAFTESQYNGDAYVIRTIGAHILEDHNAYERIYIGTGSYDELTYELDIKALLNESNPRAKYEVKKKSEGVYELKITINKTAVDLNLKEDIIFGMAVADDLHVTRKFYYSEPDVKAAQLIAKDKFNENPFILFKVRNMSTQDSLDNLTLRIFENGAEQVETNNLLAAIADKKIVNKTEDGYTIIQGTVTLKEGITLDSNTQYVLVVNDSFKEASMDLNFDSEYVPDYNYNGEVDMADLTELIKLYGKNNDDDDYTTLHDLNEDNLVDLYDLIELGKQIEIN